MTIAKIWIQIQTKWEEYHFGEKSLRAKIERLEAILRANNLDPNVGVDSNVDIDSDSNADDVCNWIHLYWHSRSSVYLCRRNLNWHGFQVGSLLDMFFFNLARHCIYLIPYHYSW